MLWLRVSFLLCLVAVYASPSEQLRKCSSKLYVGLDRIFGGQDAQPMEFPHQVSLQIRWLNSHVCGGTLISDKWVMTAAHCFSRGRYPSNWQVKLGEYSLTKPDKTERVFNVAKIFVHENYNSKNQLNDIALIKLEKSLDFNGADHHLKPVCLADQSFVVRSGHQCVVTGWGKGEKGPRVTDILQKLQQPLLDWQKCANAWKGIGWPITEKNVCVGDLTSRNGVCSGDSGGPVQCRLANGEWLQVGITSWTTSACNIQGYAAVFTQVSSHLDWIRNKVNSNQTTYSGNKDFIM